MAGCCRRRAAANKIPKSEKHFIGVVICFRWREASRVLKKAAKAALEFFMPATNRLVYEAIDLPADARVLYVGDYNVTTSGEASYQTILSNRAPNGIHQGQGIGPLNVTDAMNINRGTSTTATNILAMESDPATDLRYRDDLEVMTTNVYYGAAGGLRFVPGTYHVFGNNARHLTTAA